MPAPAQGEVWRYDGHWTLVKTTATTPIPIFELVIDGTVVATSTDDSIGNVAETIGMHVIAFFTVKTSGSSATVDAFIGWNASYRQGYSETSSVADDTLNLATAKTIEVRGRMQAAAVSCTLTVRQGFWQKVVG